MKTSGNLKTFNMKSFHKPLYGSGLFTKTSTTENKRYRFYVSFFLLLFSCSRVSIPTRDKDAAPLLTITAVDRTHNTSTEHKVDRDEIAVAPGTLMQFIATAYNKAGGVKEFTFKMSDNPYIFHRDGPPDASGKVPAQLQIATENNQPITNTYTEPGKIYEVTATAVNHNMMLNSISLKIEVYNPADPYEKSCGNFSFPDPSSFKNEDKDYPQLRTRLNFTLDPGKCCACQQIAFVQMLRFTDETEGNIGENFQPFDEQESRMVKNNSNPAFNGWAIDRADGMKWAYLARYNDGTWDSIKWDLFTGEPLDGFIQLGSNTKTATYIDNINSDKSKYRAELVIVAVCFDNSPCNGQILGYFGFSFSRNENANFVNLPTLNTFNWMPEAFDLAVAEWNKQNGKEPLNLRRIP
jgi:hypothetical protein